MKKVIAAVAIALSVCASAQAQNLDIKKCDSVVVAVKHPDTPSQEIIQLSPVKKKSVMILDSGEQFQVVYEGGRIASPVLTEVAPGIKSNLGKLPNGEQAMFIKRDGDYQVTGDGVRYLLFKDCVDATSLI